MWKNTNEQLPKGGQDVIFTIPPENDENSTAYNGRNIDVGWLDNGENNGGYCFVGRSFGYEQDVVGKWRYVPDLTEFIDLKSDNILFNTPLLVYIPRLAKSECAYRIGQFFKDDDTNEIFFESDGMDETGYEDNESAFKLNDIGKFISLNSLI